MEGFARELVNKIQTSRKEAGPRCPTGSTRCWKARATPSGP